VQAANAQAAEASAERQRPNVPLPDASRSRHSSAKCRPIRGRFPPLCGYLVCNALSRPLA
jgi:hypothetical protein